MFGNILMGVGTMKCLECGGECVQTYRDWACMTCGFRWHVFHKQPDRMEYLLRLDRPVQRDVWDTVSPSGTLAVFSWEEEM